ncbi:hypothetical protein [Propionicimonas sp.]|uniref:hypothetical protein n=1 Tax=Propionicimonas sp. TaxID=1955623 RepID=UPI0017A0523A|nr:hypothetical protein [Propionicimonas sp.]MBU3977341.1 hypothetical protein [Actinomycetota bacterium]MBA3021265.1 hypothetical protein [Propionicimonas sp.]MBU3985851.1 hypothetical protein [Actinomycetota bacterium]MBU4008636.1 hypothetical protein [Actinomycetota bacterium]MBU4066214.1 hypothetical protein [Actinomycetota bacterium]
MSDYASQAAAGAEFRTKDMAASTAQYMDACHTAAATIDGYNLIRQEVIRALSGELTEGGAKGIATKVATVALWLRRGGRWPQGRGLTAAYDQARGATQVKGAQVECPRCGHDFVP